MSQPCALPYARKGHSLVLRSETDLTYAEAHRLISYDHETGLFFWRGVHGRACPDNPAGSINNYGYRRIGMRGRNFYAHRLAWFMHHGVWPTDILDHINRDRDDNRIVNLRLSDRKLNMRNTKGRLSTLGVRGVQQRKADGAFEVRIKVGKKCIYLGRFQDIDNARAAYAAGAIKYHGEHASFDGIKRAAPPAQGAPR